MSRSISFPQFRRRTVAGLTLSTAALSVALLSACESTHDLTAPPKGLREGVAIAGQATRTIQMLDRTSGTMRVSDARTWSYSAKIAGQRAVARVAAGATTALPLAGGVTVAPELAQSAPAPATVAVLARDGGALHIVREVNRDGVSATIEIDARAGEPVSRVSVESAGEVIAVRDLKWAHAPGGWLLEREEIVSLNHGAPAARVTTIYANDDAELARSVASMDAEGRLTRMPVVADAIGALSRSAERAADAALSLVLPSAAWAQTSDPCASKEQSVTNAEWAVVISAAKLAVDCAVENVIGAVFDAAALANSISSLDTAVDNKNDCLNANPTDPHAGT